MKKNLLIMLFFASVLAVSCNKDLGNYSYSELDQMAIADFPDTVNIKVGDELLISPNLTLGNGAYNPEEFTYEWYSYDYSTGNDSKARIFLGKELTLKTIPKMLVGQYRSYLKVTHVTTGRIWSYKYILNIDGTFGKVGWFVLSAKDEKAHLDYFQDDPKNWNSNGTVYRDINTFWNDQITNTSIDFQGEPVSMEIFYNRDPVVPAVKSYLYVNTKSQTYKINQSDGFTYNSVKNNFKNETASGSPASAEFLSPSDDFASLAYKDNNIYSYYYMLNKYYNVPLNNNPNGTVYRVAPFIAMPMGNFYLYSMYYDMDAKRFMRTFYTSARGTVVNFQSGDFSTADTKMDMVWMSHTAAFNGQTVAILKKDSQYFLVRINFTANGAVSLHSVTDVTSILTDLSSAKHFALDNKYGYLFYVANDKLYQFEMDTKTLKVAKNLNGRKVSLLKSERLVRLHPSSGYSINFTARMDPVLYSIILGTYDEGSPNTSGKVEFLHVQGLMGDLIQTIKPMEGFGIVKDVQYTDMVS